MSISLICRKFGFGAAEQRVGSVLSGSSNRGRRCFRLGNGEELALTKLSSLCLDDDERVKGISEKRSCKYLGLDRQRVSGRK